MLIAREIFLPIFTIIFSIFITIFCLEAFAQTLYRFENGHWLFNPQEQFTVPYAKKVDDRRQYSLLPGYKSETININKFGFRSADKNVDLNKTYVCLIGDSVPFGAGVKDSETLSFHMNMIIAQQGFDQIKIINGGVPSYNLRQSLDRYRIDIKPHFKCSALILNAANDVSLIDFFRENWTPEVTWASARKFVAVRKYSALMNYMKILIGHIGRGVKADIDQALSKALPEIRNDLEQSLTSLSKEGIPTLLLPVDPCYDATNNLRSPEQRHSCAGYKNFQQLAERWQPIISNINDILTGAAKKLDGIYFEDTAKFFNIVGRPGMYVDFIHRSDKGNKMLAETLVNWLKEHDVLTSQNKQQ